MARIVVNESPGNRIHWYYERQGDALHACSPPQRATRAERRACKFDRNIFVATVKQSRDSVARLNVMSDFKSNSLSVHLSWRISTPCSERESHVYFVAFYFFLSCSTYLHTYFVILLEIQRRKRQCTSEFVGMWWFWANLFPRLFVSAFKHRTFSLSCLCALLSDTSLHGTNMFLVLFLILRTQEGGRMIYFSENIIVRHRLLGLRACCVYTKVCIIYLYP